MKKLIFRVAVIFFIIAGISSLQAGERFIDNGDGTVTDQKMKLMWSNTDNQGDIGWREAAKWIEYNFAYSLPEAPKYDNWRMPSVEELQSLYIQNNKGYETDCGQHVKIVDLIELSCGWVWSSEKKSITARVFNFQKGYHYTDRIVRKRGYRALPVRNIE